MVHAFCQSLGVTKADDLQQSFDEILNLTGSLIPLIQTS